MMKNDHRLIVTCYFLFLFIAGILSGEEISSPGAPTQQNNRLKTIIVAEYYPYTYVNKNGSPVGFSVDLAKAVTKVMGMDIEIKVDTMERSKLLLKTGEIDFLPRMAYSKERDKTFDFSTPYTIISDAFFTRKENTKISNIEDIKGKTVIVMKGDRAHDYLRSSGFLI